MMQLRMLASLWTPKSMRTWLLIIVDRATCWNELSIIGLIRRNSSTNSCCTIRLTSKREKATFNKRGNGEAYVTCQL